MKKFFAKALAVLLVGLFAISGFNFSILASDAEGIGEKLSAMNVEISGKLSLMLYFKNLENVEYFKVNVPERDGSFTTTTIPKSSLQYDSTKDRYLLKIKLAAAQMNEQVSIRAYSANGTAGKSYHYSIRDYADMLFAMAAADPSNTAYAAAAAAAKSMLNYGAMAQKFFDYKTDSLANDGLYYRGTNPVNDMAYEDFYGITGAEMSVDGKTGDDIDPNALLKFTQVNAYLEDTLSLRFYFSYSGSSPVEDLIVQINETQYYNEILQDENDNYYILINNIPATLFNTQYQVLLSDGPNYTVIKYSVFNYLQAALARTEDKSFQDVAYSMFQFYAWASAYAGRDIPGYDSVSATCLHERTYIDSLLGNAAICSDCGKNFGSSGVIWLDSTTSTISTDTNLSYVATGYDTVSPETGLHVPDGNTLTLSSGSLQQNTTTTNRFHIHYYSSVPAKITMVYTYGPNVTDYTARESYFLEAGDNEFSAVEYSFLASQGGGAAQDKISYYGRNEYFSLNRIEVEPLVDGDMEFVLFDYRTESVNPTISKVTYNAKTCCLSYVQNGHYKLGINLTWGGAISELYDLTANDGTINGTTNLINASDAGRLIQQSYYGTDGTTDPRYTPHYWSSRSDLAYAKWSYNPVQGGDANNNSSRIIDYEVGSDYIYIKAQPLDWANHVLNSDGSYTKTDSRHTSCYIENRYTLKNDYIQVDNRMVDYSGYTHPCTTQELPAFYTLAYFDDYYWYSGSNPWTNDAAGLKREDNLPFWGDPAVMAETTFYYSVSNTETWAAFVNESTGYGLGMYVPNIDLIKGGRVDGSEANKTADSASGYSSYFAPLKALQIVCYEPIEYSYLLCAGDKSTIRNVFTANKDFASNVSLNKNDISQKLPNEVDMSFVDFSDSNSLLFVQGVVDATATYDERYNAVKFTVLGDDSNFTINYTMDNNRTYAAGDYSCIEVTYMIPADNAVYPNGIAQGQQFYYQVGNNKSPNENYCIAPSFNFVADGTWHIAKIYTSDMGANWTGDIHSLRFDFLNDGRASDQVFYLKSVKLTNDPHPYASATEKLDKGFYSLSLAQQITDGVWDSGVAQAMICDGDYVRITSGTASDQYIGFSLGGATETGKYMIVKYRTNANTQKLSCEIFATADGTQISGNGDWGLAYGWVGDGKWHVAVIDLSIISSQVATAGDAAKLNYVRFDIFDCFPGGSTIDLAYVGFFNDLADIKTEDGEVLEYAHSEWTQNIDSVHMDGILASYKSTGNKTGAMQNSIVNGCEWSLGGWLAVNSASVSDISYCITEEDGTEHWVTVPQADSGDNHWRVAPDITSHAIDNMGYSASTVGYRVYMYADLSDYVGQTVTISVRANAGIAYITTYTVKVNVTETLYGDLNVVYRGDDLLAQLRGGDFDSFTVADVEAGKIVKNSDCTVTIKSNTPSNTGNSKWIGFIPGGKAVTGKYMVMRYRTSSLPGTGMFYTYAASGDGKVDSENDRLIAHGLVADGKWHTLVIDLSKASDFEPAENRRYYANEIRFQLLDQFANDAVFDIGYVGFCENLSDVKVAAGEAVEYAWDEWRASIDSMGVDDTPQSTETINYEAGANYTPVLSGTNWTLNGWIGINGQAVKSIRICITEDDGVEHWITVPQNGDAALRWYETDEITDHLVNGGANYAYGTIGCRFNLSVNLANYLTRSQTATITVRINTSGGRAVTMFAAQISYNG